MQAGPYTVTTEQPIGAKYYAIDEETSKDSFVALSGTIKNKLTVESYMTSKSTNYNLEVSPEHGIPENGYIEVNLPKDLEFTKNEVFSDTRDSLNKAQMTIFDQSKDRIIVKVLTEHKEENNPLRFSLLNIRNPRSYKPSKGFSIITLDTNKVRVDIGGQDINLVMNTMNFYPKFSLTPSDLTNGAINTYRVDFESKVFMLDGDILNLHFPPTVLLTD